MTRPLVVVFALACALAGGCQCPPIPDLGRYGDQDLATPESALEYFRAALEKRDAYHQHLCFSDALKRANPDLTVANLESFQDEIQQGIKARIGSVADIEIRDLGRGDRPWLHRLSLTYGNKSGVVVMVLETGYTVRWTDLSVTHGVLPYASRNPIRIQAGRAIADLSLKQALINNPNRTANDVHRLSVDRDWKILEPPPELLEQLEKAGGNKEAPKPAPKPPREGTTPRRARVGT